MKGFLVVPGGQVPKVGRKIKSIKRLSNGFYQIEFEPP